MKWARLVVNFDRRMASWMEYYGHRLLRYSLAIIFIWFGLLKPLGMSPAAELVANTVYWLPPDVFLPILGWWEVAIGVSAIGSDGTVPLVPSVAWHGPAVAAST